MLTSERFSCDTDTLILKLLGGKLGRIFFCLYIHELM
jgi:hypothetical protein